MEMLRALSHYLLDSELVAADQFSSRAECISLSLDWKPDTKGMCLGELEYRGVLEIYRASISPIRLMTAVGAWLQQHDDGPDVRIITLPGCTVSPQMDQRHHLQLMLDFKESIWLSEQPDGEFKAFHKRWALLPNDLWTAEYSDVLNRQRAAP